MENKKEKGRPTLKSIKVLKEAKKSITDRCELAEINNAIKLLQGWNTGRYIVFDQYN